MKIVKFVFRLVKGVLLLPFHIACPTFGLTDAEKLKWASKPAADNGKTRSRAGNPGKFTTKSQEQNLFRLNLKSRRVKKR